MAYKLLYNMATKTLAREVKMKKTTLVKKLEKKFVGIDLYLNDRDELFISAESGYQYKGWPIANADYYEAPTFDPGEKHHINGVHKALDEFLKKNGFTWQWYSPACLQIFEE